MSKYREDARQIAIESRWTFFRFIPLFIGVIIFISVVGFVTHSLGLWGGTIVERKVFEESYQRSETLKAQIAHDKAVLSEIERKLTNSSLDTDTRNNLEAQAAAARIRINTARGQQ